RQADLEPVSALLGAAVGERVGSDVPGRHLLQAVIAHRCSRSQAALNVALIEKIALLGGVSPNAGETVCLQFQLHRKCVRLTWAGSHGALHFLLNAQQLLNMMPNLMSE